MFLSLQSGKQCLCRYFLPPCTVQALQNVESSDPASVIHDLKIIGLSDAVEGRISVLLNNGRVHYHTYLISSFNHVSS